MTVPRRAQWLLGGLALGAALLGGSLLQSPSPAAPRVVLARASRPAASTPAPPAAPAPPAEPARTPGVEAPAARPLTPQPGERVSDSTCFLQLSVSHDHAALLASRAKPRLPYLEPARAGAFRLRVTDARGTRYERDFPVPGLVPQGVPDACLDAEGALCEGDTVRLAAVPVLVKLPGNLQAPLRCEVRGAGGRELGAFSIAAY